MSREKEPLCAFFCFVQIFDYNRADFGIIAVYAVYKPGTGILLQGVLFSACFLHIAADFTK